MKIFNKIKKANSLTEVIVMLAIVGAISTIAYPVFSNARTNYIRKTSAIRANNDIQEIVDAVLNQSASFSNSRNFVTKPGDEELFYEEFKKMIINAEEVVCPGYTGSRVSMINSCILAPNKTVWGLMSETNFVNVGVTAVEQNGRQIPYFPIAVYPYYEKAPAENAEENEYIEYFANNAILYGLRIDGNLITLDADMNRLIKGKPEKTMHYQFKEYIQEGK